MIQSLELFISYQESIFQIAYVLQFYCNTLDTMLCVACFTPNLKIHQSNIKEHIVSNTFSFGLLLY